MVNLSKPTDTMAASMKELGVSLTDQEGNMKSLDTLVRDMRKSFSGLTAEQQAYHGAVLAGKTSMPAMLALMNAAESDYNELADAIYNASGATSDMAKIMQDNVKGDFTILKSSIEGLGIAFGEALEPKVRSFLQTATGMVNAFSSMGSWSKNLLIDITALGLGFGATLLVVGKVVSMIGNFKLGMLATDITKVSGVIQTLGFGLKGLSTTLGLTASATSVIVIAIAAAAAAFIGWIYWIETADKRLAEYNANLIKGMDESRDKIKSNTDEIKNAKQALAEIQELENKVNNAQNESDRVSATQELIDKKKEILQMYPELADAFDSEASAMDGLTGALENYIKAQQEQLKLEQRKLAQQGRDYLQTNNVNSGNMTSTIDGYSNAKKAAEEYSKALDKIAKYDDSDQIPIMENGVAIMKDVSEVRKKLNEGLEWSIQLEEEHSGKLNEYYNALKAVKEGGGELTSEQTKALQEYEKALKEGFTSDAIPNTVKNVIDGLATMGSEVEQIAKKIGASTDEVNTALSRMGEVALMNFGNLNDEAANALGILSGQLEDGSITLDDFNTALDTMSIFASEAFMKLPVASQEAMGGLVDAFSTGDVELADFQTAVNTYMGLAAEDFNGLDMNGQQSINNLLSSFASGKMGIGDFQSFVSDYMNLAANDFNGLSQSSQDALNKVVSDFASGKLTAEEYQTAMAIMSTFTNGVYNGLSSTSQNTMQQLKNDFLGNKITAQEFAQGVGQSLGLTEGDLASLASASASDLGQLISDLLSGKVNADNLQSAIQAIKSKEVTVTTVFKEVGKRPQSIPVGGGLTVDEWSLKPPSESTEQPPSPTIDTYSIQPQATPSATPMSSSESTPSVSPMDSSSGGVSTSSSSSGVSTFASFTDAWDKDPYEGMSEDAKKQAQARVQAEKDANSAILKLRNDLYKALKNKIQEQKEQEMSIYDARIEAIKKEMELLDKSVTESPADKLKAEQEQLKEYQDVLSQLEAEKAKWEKNSSELSKQKQKELAEQIAEQQKKITDQQKNVAKAEVDIEKERLQEQIDLIEQEKQATEEKFDKKLTDEALYQEANKMLQQGNMEEMLKLIEQYDPDWAYQGLIFGKSLADGIKEGIEQGLDGYKYLKDLANGNSSKPGNPSPTPTPTPTPPKEEDKPKKGTVTASGLNVRSGAGTNNKILDSVYRGDEVEILESKDGWYYIDYYSKWRKKRDKGWSSAQYIKAFDTGGYTGDWSGDGRMALLHQKERVLSADQTSAFDTLVYDWIPKLESMFKNLPTSTTNLATTNGLTYNSTYNVVNKTEFDASNMEDNIVYNLKKQMKNMGKKF